MNPPLNTATLTTPLGDMLALTAPDGVCLLEFSDYPGLAAAVRAVERALGSRAVNQATDLNACNSSWTNILPHAAAVSRCRSNSSARRFSKAFGRRC